MYYKECKWRLKFSYNQLAPTRSIVLHHLQELHRLDLRQHCSLEQEDNILSDIISMHEWAYLQY